MSCLYSHQRPAFHCSHQLNTTGPAGSFLSVIPHSLLTAPMAPSLMDHCHLLMDMLYNLISLSTLFPHSLSGTEFPPGPECPQDCPREVRANHEKRLPMMSNSALHPGPALGATVNGPDFSSTGKFPILLSSLSSSPPLGVKEEEMNGFKPSLSASPSGLHLFCNLMFPCGAQTFLGILVSSVPDTSKILKVGKECSISV